MHSMLSPSQVSFAPFFTEADQLRLARIYESIELTPDDTVTWEDFKVIRELEKYCKVVLFKQHSIP